VKPSVPGDVSFEIQAQEIKGLTFEPEAMGLMTPGMPLVNAKKKTTLDKQRQAYEKAKDPVQKQAHALILATMLYEQSKKAAKGDDKTKLWQDARQVLNDAAKAAGDKVDEITLRMLGSYELLLEDFPAAEKAWGGLVAQAPKDKDVVVNKAWWAYSLLKQYKHAEALAAIQGETLSDKIPELSYVTAWAKFRTGDLAGAWQAILSAVKGWGTNPGRDALDRDVFMMAGRTDTSMPNAVAVLTPIYGKTKEQQYELFAKLGLQSYQFAGRWSDGVLALDQAMAALADRVPVNDRPVIRYQQADYTVRLDDPAKAAKYAIQSVEALPGCGAKCSDKDKANVIRRAALYPGELPTDPARETYGRAPIGAMFGSV
jgi:endonuclease III